jgi:ABC-2 type transport system ATP-binding protein
MADLRHLRDAEERVDKVLEIVHMEERSDGYIANLSKGMRQRVGLAQALLHEPEVLILDEPTIGLDPAQIREVRTLIQDLGKVRTILLSTHILSEAQQVCDRVLIINNGRIVVEDTPAKLQARLTGAERIVLKVKGETDGLKDVIQRVPGITAVEMSSQGSVEFESLPGADARPAVAREVIDAGYDLLELRPVGMSLEEIFLQLTHEEPPPPQVSDQYEEADSGD